MLCWYIREDSSGQKKCPAPIPDMEPSKNLPRVATDEWEWVRRFSLKTGIARRHGMGFLLHWRREKDQDHLVPSEYLLCLKLVAFSQKPFYCLENYLHPFELQNQFKQWTALRIIKKNIDFPEYRLHH